MYGTAKNKTGEQSRWRRSRIRRSPPPTNTSKVCITDMCNDSRRMSTECWQKSPDCSKGEKISTDWVRKEKKQQETNRDGTCAPGRELSKRKRSCTLRSPAPLGDLLGQASLGGEHGGQSGWRRHRRSAGLGLGQWVLLGLGAGTWASEVRTGERSGDGHVGTDGGGRGAGILCNRGWECSQWISGPP